jgi:hypothetical protein
MNNFLYSPISPTVRFHSTILVPSRQYVSIETVMIQGLTSTVRNSIRDLRALFCEGDDDIDLFGPNRVIS